MESMTAYCGLQCDQCPTYVATLNDDDRARAKVADQWSRQFMPGLEATDINCDGCLTTAGRLFKHCGNCNIRECCMERGLQNCAHCPEYACEQLSRWFRMMPDTQKRLEEIRAGL